MVPGKRSFAKLISTACWLVFIEVGVKSLVSFIAIDGISEWFG